MLRNRILSRGKVLTAALITGIVLMTGCGHSTPAPAVESSSEDMTEAAQTAETTAAAEEEQKVTVETALIGVCLARSETGDNERLVSELQNTLSQKGFAEDHLMIQRQTGSRSTQMKEIEDCLGKGCSLLIVAPVSDKKIPEIADKVTSAGAQVLFLNCEPDREEIERWAAQGMNAVWIGATYEQQLACQQTILYDFNTKDMGPDFNGDGHIGTILIGGGEKARGALEETARDLGSELRVLGELDFEDAEATSLEVQEILNEYRKEAELILCSTEESASAASDGVQMRHRLIGRDILVIGTDAHEDTCTAIINKLMSGSTFTDFYEQANLAAVAAKDMIEGSQKEQTISSVIFKVTEDNAQEVLDQLWSTRPDKSDEEQE